MGLDITAFFASAFKLAAGRRVVIGEVYRYTDLPRPPEDE